ncbi:MAG: LacI family DNA-binding transcriptional regulator [Microbacterium sp.]
MPGRVSMADVAAVAGVSAQTVSRVVNGSPRVDPATRARVESAMAQLGYRMHRAARALRTGRTDAIGLVVSTLATTGNSRMLQAVADAASARDLALTVVTAQGADAVARGFARLRDQGVDGAIVLNEATAASMTVAVPDALALVVVDAPAVEEGALRATVQTDHAAGARAATAYLLSLGHDTVHHLAGPEGSYAAAERERGWRAALAAAGRPEPEPLRGEWTSASGHVAVTGLDEAATALFAANDQMALGAMRAFADAGRRVPDDVAVVGFDDVEDAAQYHPPLTTVRQDFDALGAAAVASLVALIAGERAAPVVLEPKLVRRASA